MNQPSVCNRRRNLIILACLGASATAIIAVTLFKVPISSLFFFGTIVLCPLMHLFMGHGAHGHGAGEVSQEAGKTVVSIRDESSRTQ